MLEVFGCEEVKGFVEKFSFDVQLRCVDSQR